MQEKFRLFEMIKINFRGLKIIQQFGKSVWSILGTAIVATFRDYWYIWFVALLINDINARASKERIICDLLILVIGKFVINSLHECILGGIYQYQGSDVWERTNAHLNYKLLDLDYEYMEEEHIQNWRRNIDQIAETDGGGLNVLYWRIFTFVRNTLSIGIALVSMIQMIWNSRNLFADSMAKSLLCSVGFILFLLVLVWFGMKYVGKLQIKQFKIMDDFIPVMRDMSYYVFQYLEKESAGKEIRLFGQQPLLMKYINELYQKVLIGLEKRMYFENKVWGFRSLLQNAILCLIYFYLGVLALTGGITVGTVFLYAGSISVFTRCFGKWVSEMTRIAANTKYLKYYLDFLDIPNKKYEGTLPVEKRTDDQFELEFRNVSFKYPGSEEYVLKNFSIKFRIGERLAVVGKNGSGKTTFIKLLCRLYDPTEGEILLNGIDIRKYDYQEYLSLFSVVFQDYKLLALSLGQNVATAVEYDKEKVRTALQRAGLSELSRNWEQGYDTPLYTDFDSSGVDISGGEAQKVAIARALYHDTPFVILDEPTAALDPLAEFEIYSKFDELVGTKTAVYISHRLSSCQFCNDIMVLDGGKVVQRGNHAELEKDREGLYYQMWHAQAQYYERG